MPQKRINRPQAPPPAATGNAGPQFEAKVGAFYLLALISNGEPRALPGATIRTVEFQQRGSGRPLDDVIIQATNADGSAATLEIQAKRTLTFTTSDSEFTDVVVQMWDAAQKPEFATTRYELAVAMSRTTTRVEQACQEVLHWARQLPDGATFAAHINREKFASNGMRDFVDVFRKNLAAAGGSTDDKTIWQLLRRFNILVFDFESHSSDYEHRARERARFALAADQTNRASDLWPILIESAGACARAGGALDRPAVVTPLETEYGFRFDPRADLRPIAARLSEAADRALNEIKDQVGGVRLSRGELIDQASALLDPQRILHIVGAPGVGKTSVMKHLARRLQPEGRIIVMRNGRIIPGGWLSMAHAIDCKISQDELFNELGCGGGATLFIDNIDQIDNDGDWATVTDLLSGVAKNPGWRAVVTGGVGNDDWKTKLPADVSSADIVTLQVEAINDDETEVLSDGNQALAVILRSGHPAQGIARNLFYLSRMIELGAGQADAAAGIATEIDLAELWWLYGGGRGKDDGRLSRLKVLRAIGTQVLANPGRVAFNIDELDSLTVAELLRFDSLREEITGATVAFRHDVLRDWSVGFLLHDYPEQLNALPMDRPLPPGLARGLEITARLALERDATGARWLQLLGTVERDGCHGSWKRPVLLALPRSEQAFELFFLFKSALVESDGRRLSEIIRLMIAVESVPLAKVIAKVQPSAVVPSGAGDLILLKGPCWTWFVLWLVAEARSLPTTLIPDLSKVFQAWLMSTQHKSLECNSTIVELLFEWLTMIEDRMSPRSYSDVRDERPSLHIPHVRDVRDEIRMTVFSFAHLNPAAAERYISGLDPDVVRHHEMKAILSGSGTLTKAAPKALANFALGAIIEKEDPDDRYRGSDRFGPFGAHDHLFSPASPGQGPFFELLEQSPDDGLRLVRGLVKHATQWRRDQYIEARQPFPRISIPFPHGTKSFEGDWSVYQWARSVAPSAITASALMALEAWGHRQIEAGRPFADILDDVLGPDGSSIAFVSVAIDLALSHWTEAHSVAWPIVATPELLEFDDARHSHDIAGTNRVRPFQQEPTSWRVKCADLDAKASRRKRLSDTIGYYVFHGDPAQLQALRAALEQAANEIGQKPAEDEDPISGLRATAERAVRMTNAEHWPLVKIKLNDGSEAEVRQFQRAPEEVALIEAKATRLEADMRHHNVRIKVQFALFDPTKSTAQVVSEGIEWAKAQPANAKPTAAEANEDEEEDDFDKQSDRRAFVMAAALAARDFDGPDRSDVIGWALQVLRTASTEKGREYTGNDQIEYNIAAIAAVGLVELFLKDQERATRDLLLQLASNRHLSVVKALGSRFSELARIDARLLRSLIRIVMITSIHPRRAETKRQDETNRRAYREKIEAVIALERQWLDGSDVEPAWPELPAWYSRPRRSFRIGEWIDESDDEPDETPECYIDERTLGAVVGYLIRLTVGDLPTWLVDLAGHLMRWTNQANGPHGEDDRDRDNRPSTWNSQFFEFLGILSVALPHDDVTKMFLEPIVHFRDEAFYDVMAEFLRGFDRAMQAIDTRTPEDPVAVRALLVDRIRKGRNFKYLGREKGFTTESHAGDALNAMFYQPHRLYNRGQATIPDNWTGLDATMPMLTSLVTDAPSSGYLTSLFLNLVESSPRPSLLPFVVQATTAWCLAYGVDTNFWSEKNVGVRVCAWLDRTLTSDISSDVMSEVVEDLLKSLDILIQSGVAQAREIEEQLSGIASSRKTA
ncbi:ATP-binding protein [Bradyrhizobium sp. 1.29L]